MRLALIRQRYTPYGGAERFLEAALEALLERDVAITLYARNWPEMRLQLIEPHVIDPFYVGRLWRDWSFARAVARAVGTAKIDVVQSHERLTCCDVYRAGDGVHAVWLQERARGAPLRRIADQLSPYHRYVLAMERKMFASPWLRAVICNSRMVRDEIHEHYGVADDRLRVIYNAVDSNAFHPGLRQDRAKTLAQMRIPADAVVYLYVGSGYERKGVATALEAFAELPPNAHLVVVGRDKAGESYERRARAFGVAGRVHFEGAQRDVRPYYGAADVFVLPTVYDPFPNAALEAMACGLPVLTSTKSGSAELVVPHDAGLISPARDVAGLAAQMRTLLDADTRARMGANARAAVLPLTPESMTLQLVLLYKELLEASVAQRKASAARRAAERAEYLAKLDAHALKAAAGKAAAGATQLAAADTLSGRYPVEAAGDDGADEEPAGTGSPSAGDAIGAPDPAAFEAPPEPPDGESGDSPTLPATPSGALDDAAGSGAAAHTGPRPDAGGH